MQNNRGQGHGRRQPLEYVHTKMTYKESVPDQQSGELSDRLVLYLTPEQAYQLADLIYKMAENSQDGIRMTTYTGARVNSQTQELFDSTSISVQRAQFNRQGGGQQGGQGSRRPQGRTGGFQRQGRASAPAPGNGGRGAGGQQRQQRRAPPVAPEGGNQGNTNQEAGGGSQDFNFQDFGPEPSFNQSEDIPF